MGIGGSILIVSVGAILAFGLKNQDLGPLNLDTIGWILMVAGLFGLVLTIWVWNSRRTRSCRRPHRNTRRSTRSTRASGSCRSGATRNAETITRRTARSRWRCGGRSAATSVQAWKNSWWPKTVGHGLGRRSA